MFPTFLDLETGITASAIGFEFDIFWWSEGNGNCDCNRAEVFGEDVHEEMEQRMRAWHHGIKDRQSYCYNTTRFVMIDVHGDLEGCAKADILRVANQGYPEFCFPV